MTKDKKLSRRDFLKESSIVAAGVSMGISKVGAPAYAKTLNANEVIRIGIIGTGSRGNYLMDEIRKLENIEITDLCDIYPPNLEQGWERNGKKGRKHTNYKTLIEQKDIDAVFVVTPLVYHVQQSIDSLSAGKHVFCEKSLAYSVKEANDMVRAMNYYSKKFLVGYSRWTNITDEIKKIINENGIGKLHHIFTHYHNNLTWVKNVDDPKWFRRLNWRLYWEYCGGQMTELASHQITKVNYILDSHPISAIGTGSIDFYNQYDRETWDNVDVIFEYPNHIKVNTTVNFMTQKLGVTEEFVGTNGTIESGGFERDKIRLFWEQKTEHLASLGIKKGTVDVKLGESLKLDASPMRFPGKEVTVEGDRRNLVAHFFDCIRNDKEPVINAEEGRRSSITALMANQAIRLGRKVTWDEMLAMG